MAALALQSQSLSLALCAMHSVVPLAMSRLGVFKKVFRGIPLNLECFVLGVAQSTC